MTAEKKTIKRAESAEAAGVSSAVVQEFIDRCISEKKELHSIMVIRHGEVACEAFRAPYSPEYRHMMYSVSKSFTSTAIGLAISEGYLTLKTKFLDIFPEARPQKEDKYLEQLCVEDLLTMRSGLHVSIFMDKTKDTWFEQIIGSPWISEPGTQFLYISENMYLLCAMIHKLTGMSVMEYLKPRLFEPLGIEDPFWETCPKGVEAGGWGMMIKTEDLAKFTLLYQQHGKFNGKQILDEEWTRAATSFQTDNSGTSENFDSGFGYGYCFWRNGGCKESYRADGMFSQFGIVFEELDACLIITAGEVDEQGMRDLIWQYFPKAFTEDGKSENAVKISIPPYAALAPSAHSPLEKKLEGKRLVFNKPILLNVIGFPVSMVTLPALFMERDKAGNISNVSLSFYENELYMTWSEGDEINRICAGMDGQYRSSEIVIGQIPYTALSMARWNGDEELELLLRPIETVAARRLVFKFKNDRVTMKPTCEPSSAVMGETLKESVKTVIKPDFLGEGVSKVTPYVFPILDYKHYGKIK